MVILGIDVGLTGGVAAVTTSGQFLMAEDMPVIASGGKTTKVQRQVDARGLAELIQRARALDGGSDVWMAAVERVSSMPGQGVSSVFSLGDSFGCIRAVLATKLVACEFPTAASWKRHYGLDSDKERSRSKAIQLFPAASTFLARKKDHGRAEALLLAEWLRRRTA